MSSERHAARFRTLALLFALSASADARSASPLSPDAMFMQIGGGTPTQTFTFGGLWALPWHKQLRGGALSMQVEASLGRWWTGDHGQQHTAWVTQLGLTPVLHYRGAGGDSSWFTEAGVGVNVLAPVFRDGDREFTTAFNFGDHVAVGRTFGVGSLQEVSLRLQHFSNAGIKHPNPGVNFIQMRYAVWF